MSLPWIILGTIAQLMLALFLFMLVVFSGGGLVTGNKFSKIQMDILNLSMFVLPGACIVSVVVVWMLYWHGAGVSAYWWYALPLAATGAYLAYAISLGRQV
jgi:hypothetical protein